MIDKIVLHLKHGEFTLVEGSNYTVVTPRMNISTGEQFKGFEFSGITISKAYVSTDIFSLNITNYGAYINFNPRKIINGHNGSSLAHQQFLLSIKALKYELKGYLDANIDMAEIRSLELPLDTVLDHDACIDIGKLWNSLDAQYLDHKKVSGGHYIGNSTREYSFYDKTKELKEKSDVDIGSNIFRVELKIKTKKKVQELTPLKYLSDLLVEDNFNCLPYCFHKIFEKDFSTSVVELLLPNKEMDIINLLREKYNKGYMDRYWDISNGLDGILEKHGGISGYREFMKSIGLSKDVIKRQVSKIKSLLLLSGQLGS